MVKKKRKRIEFRYYKLPNGSPVLALLGEKWIQHYGLDVEWLHFHNYMEIGFCYEGEGRLTLGERDFRFSGREFTVIPRNYPHTTLSDPGNISRWEYLFVDVEDIMRYLQDNPVRMERILQRINSGAFFFKEEEHPELAAKILHALNTMRNAEEFYLEEVRGDLLSILSETARLNVEEKSGKTEKDKEKKSESNIGENFGRVNETVGKAVEYISAHYMEEIKIEELALACHLSETHFRRLFSEYMQTGPLEYINMVRIQEACKMLRKSDDSVADIAHKCGFGTNSTFNRNFRQIMGITPLEWRKRPGNYEQQLLNLEIHTEEGW